MRILLVVSLLFCRSLLAQDLHYARTVIDLLTAPDMHGRGYVSEGHIKAANYIAGEFSQLGLQAFSLNYQQPFTVTVNTFPKQMSLKADGEKLLPGTDFLIDPTSPGIRGKFEVLNIRLDTLLNNLPDWVKAIKQTGKAICLHTEGYDDLVEEDRAAVDGLIEVLKYNPGLKIPLLMVVDDKKLTWGISQSLAPRPSFHIRSGSLGSDNIRKIKVNVSQNLLRETSSQNVIGMIEGSDSDSVIAITAHYDHLGTMGKRVYFPGANDNASGVAMLLSLARHFSFFEKPKYTMLFMAFGGEEAGLVGSRYYVNRPVMPLDRIKFLINLDIVGTGEEGIMVVNGKVYDEEFQSLIEINKNSLLLPDIKARGSACNSDHCAFDQHGVRGFFIYTLGGIKAYHDTQDRSSTLPLTEFEDLFKLLHEFILKMN